MSNAVATVTYTQGQVWAKSPDGSLRPLQAGSLVNADEVIVTAEGASVELDFGDGIPVAIAGNQEVAMGRDLWDELAAGADEAAVDDESVRQALAILEQGGDLLEELEDTAAGLAGGAGGGGISFVQLARLTIDTPEPQRFDFNDTLPLPTPAAQQETGSINYPPVTADLTVQGDEDTAITGRILATDADGDTLTYQITTQAAHGSVVLDTATGQFVYLPTANYHGADNFVVTVTDARGNSTTSTISVTVVPANDLPVTADVNLSTDEDAAVAGQVLATDVDGDTLGYTLGTAPANGSVTLDPVTGDFVYTPAANFNGTDSFVVVISDGQGGSVTSRVAVNVAPVNDAPVTSNLALTTDEDVAVTGQISATDVDGDTLNFITTTAPQNGVVVLNPSTGEFTYTPNSHHNGSDSFIVTISDGNGGTTTSTVTIGVTPVNDSPVVVPVALADINEDGSIVITQADLLAGASDLDGDALTAINLSLTTGNGSLIDNGNGTWTFTPATDWNGDVSFAFEVSDGTVSMPNTASLTVVSENDAPVASDLALTNDEDVAVTGQISATDVDGDTLNFTTTTAPQNGVLVLNPSTGEFTYTPNSHHNGADSFIVTISDGNGGTTTSAVTIGVTPVNDAPVIAPVALADINEDGSIVITQADLLAGASDLDGDALTAINLSLTTGNGSLIDNGNGTWTFTPATDWNGDVGFAFEVSDGTVNIPNTASLTVVSENDAPVASDLALTTDEDVAVTGQISATDVDGDTLSFTTTTAPQNGVVVLNPSTGEFTYTPSSHHNGSDSFIVTISDGNGGTTTSTVTIGVTPVNDSPVVVPVALADINEDGSIVITQADLLAGASDLDGDALTAINLSLTTGNGSLIDNGNGTWTFTPATDWNGDVGFAFEVSDGTVNIPNTASLTVVSENDAPVASDLALTTDEDVAVTGQVRATDVDGDTLNFTTTTAPQNGVLVLNPSTGEFTYTPNSHHNGADSFIVTISDGNGGTTTSTVTIDVTPINDAPVIAPVALADINEDGSIVITQGDLLADASDLDGDALTVINLSLTTGNGSLIDNGDDTWTFTPATDWNGDVSFAFEVSDGITGVPTTAILAVVPVNDAPVAADEGVVFSSGLHGEYWAYNRSESDDGASLNNLNQVQRFIMKRPADANFLATEIDYGSITGDLGADGKLQEFLDQDRNSLSNDPINTSQAIIKMSGFIYLAPGEYQLRVTADDGYSIRIDGEIVAQYDGNQRATMRLGPKFSMASDGKQLIEIIYWDSVDEARLLVEMSRDGGEFSTLTGDILSSSNDAFTATEDESLVLSVDNLLSNDTDVEGDNLTIQSVQDSVNGTVSLAGDNIIFTPDANYAGPASFTYTVNDGNGGTSTATVTINIKPVNDTPILANHHAFLNAVSASGLRAEFYNYNEPSDGPNITSLDIVESFIGANAPNATFMSTSLFYGVGNNNLGAGDNLQNWIGNDSGSLIYQNRQSTSDAILHAQGKVFLEAGIYNFRVRADDGYSIKINGDTVAEINYIQSPTGSVHDPFTITQSGYYDLDVLYWDQGGQFVFEVEVSSDGGLSYSPIDPSLLSHQPQMLIYTVTADELLINATDVDGDNLNLLRVDNAVGGSASFNATTGIVTFIVEPGYTGRPSFEYTITDGKGGQATATTFVNVVRNQFQGGEGSETITGTASNDQINALNGNDTLIGGAGNDYLSGGLGADTFAWRLGDAGSTGMPAVDKISDINLAQGDVLSLADLLQGEESSPLTDYLHFENDGSNTRIHVSSTGGYADAGYDAGVTDQIIVLEGVSLSGTNAEIITQLQNANNLLVD